MISVLAMLGLAAQTLAIAGGTKGQEDLVSLGVYRIGSREVEAKIPGLAGPFGQDTLRWEYDGASYLADSSGKLLRRLSAQGGWSEWRALAEAARSRISERTPVWRVKALVLNRVDVLDRAPVASFVGAGAAGTLLSVRRHSLDARQLDHVYESLAQFAALLEAETGGALTATVDVEVDGEWARLDSDVLADPHALASWFRERVYPRVNGGDFEPEDRVYRGPYDSIFCIHAGMFDDPRSFDVLGMPVTTVSWPLRGPGRGPYGLTFSLLEGWRAHLLRALRQQGFDARSSTFAAPAALPEERREGFEPPSAIGRCFGEANWGKVSNCREAPTHEFVANGQRAAPKPWSQVAYEGLWKLPDFEGDLGRRLGGTEVKVQARGRILVFEDESTPVERRTLELGREAWASFSVSDKLYLAADPDCAALAAGALTSGEGLRAVAKLEGPFGVVVIFDASGIELEESEAASLRGARRQGTTARSPLAAWDGSEIPLDVARIEGMIREGTFSVASVEDLERGPCLEVKPGDFPRRGQVWLLGSADGPPILDGVATSFVSLWIKAERTEPLELRAAPADASWAGASWAIFGSVRPPAELGEPSQLPVLDVPQDGTWQRIVVDLRSADPNAGSLPLAGISIGSSRFAGFREPSVSGGVASFRVHGLSASAQAPGRITGALRATELAPSANAASPLERALFAASAGESADPSTASGLAALLKDASDLVKLNAAAAFSRIASADAVPALVEASASLDARVSEQASLALARQNTEAAWAALRRSLEIGPFDYCREFAARAFRERPDSRMLGSMTVLFTSRSWRARAEGAAALAAMGTPEADRAMLIFLYEVEPTVRLATVRAANVQSPEVARRLLWHAVNDSSDAVRVACYLALLRSTNEELRSEGAKGVRDESVAVRIELLDLIEQAPGEAARGALRLAVADASPSVRAAALRAFAKLPGAVTLEEVRNVVSDRDPRVRAAFEALAKAKGLRLPEP